MISYQIDNEAVFFSVERGEIDSMMLLHNEPSHNAILNVFVFSSNKNMESVLSLLLLHSHQKEFCSIFQSSHTILPPQNCQRESKHVKVSPIYDPREVLLKRILVLGHRLCKVG